MIQTQSPPVPIKHSPRWHSSDDYMLPADAEESARLQLQHDTVRKVFENRLVLCPLKIQPGDEILDVGAGQAAWALDFIYSYPGAKNDAKTICVDITDRLFPKSAPNNLEFQVQNVLNLPPEWTGRFAFVHQRLLVAALKKTEWERAILEVYRVTKSGGWVQFCEANTVSHMDKCGPATAKFMDLHWKVWEKVGLDAECSLNIGPIMQKIGFVNVKTEHRVVELGEWNGELGSQYKKIKMGVYRGFKTPVLRMGGLGVVKDEAEYDKLMDDMEEEWKKPGAAYGYYMITGQKPGH